MSLQQQNLVQFEFSRDWMQSWVEVAGTCRLRLSPRAHPLAESDPADESGLDLSAFWADLYDGVLSVLGAFATAKNSYVVATRAPRYARKPLTLRERTIVGRVLSGEQQKSIASDLNLAGSTVATYYMHALRTLGMTGRLRTVPLPLIVCAHVGAVALQAPRAAALAPFASAAYAVVPRPRTDGMHELTPAEREVARLVIEGTSKRRIGLARSTSIHTVTNQLHAIFTKLKLSGRFALTRFALMRGCFG
jgi:DNA-binding NarL/FixJ family response regulator